MPKQDYNGIFPGAQFKLLCAFRTQQDFIGAEWIDKLAQLSQQDGQGLFECTVRVKGENMYQAIQTTSSYFNAEFYASKIKKTTDKIWICGPPAM